MIPGDLCRLCCYSMAKVHGIPRDDKCVLIRENRYLPNGYIFLIFYYYYFLKSAFDHTAFFILFLQFEV